MASMRVCMHMHMPARSRSVRMRVCLHAAMLHYTLAHMLISAGAPTAVRVGLMGLLGG